MNEHNEFSEWQTNHIMNNKKELSDKIKQRCENGLEKVLLNLEHIKSIKSKEYWTTVFINSMLTKNDVILAYQKGIDEYKLTLKQ